MTHVRIVIGCVLLALVAMPSCKCSSSDTRDRTESKAKKKPREARVHDDDRDLDDRDDRDRRDDRDDRDRDDRDDRDDVRVRPDRDDPPPPSPRDPDDEPWHSPDPPTVDDDPPARPTTGSCISCNPGDCPGWTCECEDGTSSKVRVCINGCCKSKAETCGRSCDKHDGVAGTWDRVARGGDKTGVDCRHDRDCASRVCTGYCTKRCESSSDCPSFWECTENDAGAKLCIRR